MINQAIGDALSDMLLSLAIMKILNFSITDWTALYTDLPSKQQKVPVKDKSSVICSEDETKIVTPIALQNELEIAMRSVSQGRCFVRPSGTEDVVRIYAEAATTEEANNLADLANAAILRHLG